MSTPLPPHDLSRLRELGEELLGELTSLIPNLTERTRGHASVAGAIARKLECGDRVGSVLSLLGLRPPETDEPSVATSTAGATRATSPTTGPAQAHPEPSSGPAKQKAAKQAPAKKTPAKKTPAKRVPAKQAPARKTPAERAPAKKAPAKKAPATRTPATRTSATQAPAKQAAARRAPAKQAPAKQAAAQQAPESPPSGARDLAIPGYDALAASQVIPRLDSLSAGELEALRLHELGGRGRRTILTRIAQLQGR